MQRENETKYILIYFGAIFCFALGGAFVRYSVLLPCSTGFYRMLLTVLILLPIVWRELRHTNRRDVRNLLLGGLLFGLNIWLWNYSLVATTQANANLLANLHVFVTAPVSCLVYHEKLRGHFFLGIGIALLGLVMLILGKADPQPGYFIGDVAAFITALVYGGYLMTTYVARDRCSTACTLFLSALGSLFVLFPVMLLSEGFSFPARWDAIWPLLVIVAIGQFGGIGLVSYCLGSIQVSLGSTLSLTQPAIGALLGLVLFGEKLSWMELLAILIISCGVYLAQRRPAVEKKALGDMRHE